MCLEVFKILKARNILNLLKDTIDILYSSMAIWYNCKTNIVKLG